MMQDHTTAAGEQSPAIQRFSSRTSKLAREYFRTRLSNARSYDRIAGYFRSSILQLAHEELHQLDRIRIVCNSDLDPKDVEAAHLSKEHIARRLMEKWHESDDPVREFSSKDSYQRLTDLLVSGKLEIRVVSRERSPFLHGKAGLITTRDGKTSAFIGSVNESMNGWEHSYETLWEDQSPEAARWVQEEFDALWKIGVPLPDAVLDEVARTAKRIEVRLDEIKDNAVEVAKAAFAETPIRNSGENLAPWQKAFVEIWSDHRKQYGAARLLLCDEVGVGKTLSMAATGALSVILGDGPFLILCPATLTEQWQVELYDKLGLPSAVWKGAPYYAWVDHTGHVYRSQDPDAILRCPCQIGIVSTGIITAGTEEAEKLRTGRFGMVALDEGHKARRKRGAGKDGTEKGKLYDFMTDIASRTRHLVIGTATPIQTHTEELHDLLLLLARGNPHVLGENSLWLDPVMALDVYKDRKRAQGAREAWEFLRNPLRPASEDRTVFESIRNHLGVRDDCFILDKPISDITDDWVLEDIDRAINGSQNYIRLHSPLANHVVLRRRGTLEDAGLMPKIDVELHPQDNASHHFVRNRLHTPGKYDEAYELVTGFTQRLSERVGAGGFMRTMLMQRICSSVHAGKESVKRMLELRGVTQEDEDDVFQEDLAVELELLLRKNVGFAEFLKDEARELKKIQAHLDQLTTDPKADAVKWYLVDKGWLEDGSIIFSQYYDTTYWMAHELSRLLPSETIAVYAGKTKSGILLGGNWRSVDREDIKSAVRNRHIRLVCATDAACEGLNLQTLGTLINVDLPWNPARLEQRIGRIKRFGQALSRVRMANLVYENTQDAIIFDRISERLQERHEILGSLPDVIETDWIDNIEGAAESFRLAGKTEEAKDLFELRYGNFLKGDGRSWETHAKVLSSSELRSVLSRPWRSSSSKQ